MAEEYSCRLRFAAEFLADQLVLLGAANFLATSGHSDCSCETLLSIQNHAAPKSGVENSDDFPIVVVQNWLSEVRALLSTTSK